MGSVRFVVEFAAGVAGAGAGGAGVCVAMACMGLLLERLVLRLFAFDRVFCMEERLSRELDRERLSRSLRLRERSTVEWRLLSFEEDDVVDDVDESRRESQQININSNSTGILKSESARSANLT